MRPIIKVFEAPNAQLLQTVIDRWLEDSEPEYKVITCNTVEHKGMLITTIVIQ